MSKVSLSLERAPEIKIEQIYCQILSLRPPAFELRRRIRHKYRDRQHVVVDDSRHDDPAAEDQAGRDRDQRLLEDADPAIALRNEAVDEVRQQSMGTVGRDRRGE